MSECFKGCTSLKKAPVLPSNVKYTDSCFAGCTSLTEAPEIPATVTNMYGFFRDCTKLTAATLKCDYNSDKLDDERLAFQDLFKGCTSLTNGSVKVPAGQLAVYKANAATMAAEADWFIAGE